MSKIKFLIMDVDGTLTDGKIYISSTGEMFKAFDIKDGYGIHSIIRKHGIEPVIITGRTSEIVAQRCRELNIEFIYQGVADKKARLDELLMFCSQRDGVNYSYANCVYIGDDIPDKNCMELIKNAGGLIACPADAIEELTSICHFVCTKKAGEGAVRELIEYICRENIA